MHLTNCLIDDDDDLDTDSSRKRSLKYLFDYLKKQHQNVDVLWEEIQVNEIFRKNKNNFFSLKNIVIKTVFLAEPHLLNAYRQCRSGALPSSESVCFELLGFDIFIDKNLKPWIIDVSFMIS
jgi:tubulin polyglutamylase TTLL7